MIAFFYSCGIPVILMGETGCGKTRLIKYMCDLRVGASGIRNMVLIKVKCSLYIVNISAVGHILRKFLIMLLIMLNEWRVVKSYIPKNGLIGLNLNLVISYSSLLYNSSRFMVV